MNSHPIHPLYIRHADVGLKRDEEFAGVKFGAKWNRSDHSTNWTSFQPFASMDWVYIYFNV
jgi:hypothetical protein